VFTAERTWNSFDLIGFLKALPWANGPRVVVLDIRPGGASAVEIGTFPRPNQPAPTAVGGISGNG
jgi:hypothetical protein